MQVKDIAKVCHEVNRAHCAAFDDHSQEPWEDAPEWQIKSTLEVVKFNIENPDAPIQHSHDQWMKEKSEAGWKWGPVKDPEKKEHPDLKPYARLSCATKAKDYIFATVVRQLTPFLEK